MAIPWTDIVPAGTSVGFITRNTRTYGYRTDISPTGDSRGLNIVGNPAGFSASTAPGTNINYGRARNALRQFVYEALRNESDYTDAQARAWAGEIFFLRQNNNLITAPSGQTSTTMKTWVPWTGAGGSQSNLNLGSRTSAGVARMGALNGQIVAVAIQTKDPDSSSRSLTHARAWKIKDVVTANADGTTNDTLAETYDKMTDAEMRTEFIESAPLPTAVAGTISVPNQTVSALPNQQRFVDIPTATGGTGDVSYAYSGLPSGVTGTGIRITIPASQGSFSSTVTVTATWTSGSTTATASDTFTLAFTRGSAQAVAGSFTAGSSTLRLNSGTAGTFAVGAASGGTGTISYSLQNAPTGFSISNRTVTVAAGVAGGSYTLSVRATWTSGSTTAHRDSNYALTLVRVTIAQRGTYTIPNKTAQVIIGRGGSFQVEGATGGAGSLSYALVSPPAGFSNSGTTVLMADSVTAGNHNLTMRATWSGINHASSQTRDASFTVAVTRVEGRKGGGSGSAGMSPVIMAAIIRERRKKLLDDD